MSSPETTARPRSAAVGLRSIAIMGSVAGLVATVVYAGFETHHFGLSRKVSLGGSTDTISVFHYPLIWLLLSVMFGGVYYAIAAVRGGRVRGHRVRFGVSVVVSLLILIFYAVPLVGRLTVPVDPTAPCSASPRPTTNPVVIRHATSTGFCPVEVTVHGGTTITFVSDDGNRMQIGSDYAALTQQSRANRFTTTVTKPGTFLYTDGPSEGPSVRRFVSELLGRTQSHQGVIHVLQPR